MFLKGGGGGGGGGYGLKSFFDSRDLSKQFWCLVDGTKNWIFYFSFETQSS